MLFDDIDHWNNRVKNRTALSTFRKDYSFKN